MIALVGRGGIRGAVEIDGGIGGPHCTSVLDPDEIDAIVGDLRVASDLARQAAMDGGIDGPAVVVDLVVGQEPESGVEFFVLVDLGRRLPVAARDRRRMVRFDLLVGE